MMFDETYVADSTQFVDIEPVTDHLSSCVVKVMYHGFNQNGGYISKAVAEQMAASLPGTPIVGKFLESVDDFGGHEESVKITKDGVKFIQHTKPYGVVDPNTPVTWKTFKDADGVEREYLTVRGFLWTGRYPELKDLVENGKSQSMELFRESIKGFWAKPEEKEDSVFVYSEGVISALCILGDDVAPCYEGASVTVFSKNSEKKEFFQTHFSKVLKEEVYPTNTIEEGGNNVNEFELDAAKKAVEKAEKSKKKEDVTAAKEKVNALEKGEEKDKLLERLNKIEVEEEEEPKEKEPKKQEPKKKDMANASVIEELKTEIAELREKFSLVEEENSVLIAEKEAREMAEKEAVVAKFSALDEEIVEPILEHGLDKFSLEEIETQLSALAFKAGFSLTVDEEEEAVITPNFSASGTSKPAWAEVVRRYED